MFHEIRGGTRGGQGLFKWEDVKEDKDRENYLGHSLKASVGRWQKNRDLGWYSKDKDDVKTSVDLDELAEIKQREAEAFAQALGGHVVKRQDTSISKEELKKVIKKDFEATESESIVGIGYGKRLLGISQNSLSGDAGFVKSKEAATEESGESRAREDAKDDNGKEDTKKKEKKDKKKKKKKKDHKEKSKRRRDVSSDEEDRRHSRDKKRRHDSRSRSRSRERRSRY